MEPSKVDCTTASSYTWYHRPVYADMLKFDTGLMPAAVPPRSRCAATAATRAFTARATSARLAAPQLQAAVGRASASVASTVSARAMAGNSGRGGSLDRVPCSTRVNFDAHTGAL